MVGLLEEGTGDMNAAAFLRRTEELAAHFSFDASRDQLTVTAEVLRDNRAMQKVFGKGDYRLTSTPGQEVIYNAVTGKELSRKRLESR